MKKWRWDTSEPTEIRPVSFYNCFNEMGRSGGVVDCPFCGHSLVVYWWSLAGSGKRCSCGAMIGQAYAYHFEER